MMKSRYLSGGKSVGGLNLLYDPLFSTHFMVCLTCFCCLLLAPFQKFYVNSLFMISQFFVYCCDIFFICHLTDFLLSSKFRDIFDEDYFIETLRNHVRVVKELPKDVLQRFNNNMSNILNMRTKALASKTYYLQKVLPKLLELGYVFLSVQFFFRGFYYYVYFFHEHNHVGDIVPLPFPYEFVLLLLCICI